ncbi:serine/threonine protein kinase [Ancylothrix sp. C2]|uniref:serine/threonine-protein kinase n=1 Tax=Ancylothrix sp. D3o TaxID=2953691 RepID=UPI0021BAFCF8|nr:serine/threonine-protein kinase [Ancylothrix sp. D3o]MCT7950105.1 serine/threonine protein kinase [Ancylothrix sp. D3o]
MSYCLNSSCQTPQNHPGAENCVNCGTKLLLKDRYRTIKVLGQSSFCRTFLAIDQDQPAHPHCVIKQYTQETTDSTPASSRVTGIFKLFYQTAKQLDELGKHPAIPKLWASFQQGDQYYLVKQYIEGENLAEELNEVGDSSVSETEIRTLLKQILPVLHFAHSRKIIHGDIKPENIISRQKDKKNILVDWGDSQLFAATGLYGSAEYSAPEQLHGQATASSDLYSLGLTCLYLLTQISPFDLFDVKAGEWAWRDYLKTPVSYSLGKILDKLVQRNPKQRYQSASEVISDLHSWMMPVPTTHHKTRLAAGALGGAVAAMLIALLHPRVPTPLPTTTYTIEPAQITTLPEYNTYSSNESWGEIQPLRTLAGDTGPFWSVAVSPDGQTVATGSFDGSIKLWNLHSGGMESLLAGHFGAVWAVAISPDGQTLASASSDKTIKLWNVRTGELLETLNGHTGSVFSVAFSPNGKILASVSEDKTIKLWDTRTGIEERTLKGHNDEVQTVAFSPDNKTLVSGSSDGTVKLWNAKNGKLQRTLKGHNDAIWSVGISPDGEYIASGSWDNTIKMWSLETGDLLNTFIGHSAQVQSVAFSPDGETLASGDMNGTIKLWQVGSGGLVGTLKGHSALVKLAFNPQGKMLVSGSFDDTVKLWRLCP